jgi:hypothetical protein
VEELDSDYWWLLAGVVEAVKVKADVEQHSERAARRALTKLEMFEFIEESET